MKTIRVDIYFDEGKAVRGLVSVFEGGQPIQTVGSAIVGNASELDHIIRAAQYTLNAFQEDN